MPKTEVILLQPIVGLGAESDQVKVAPGYARNFLLPHGLAIPVTAANKRRLEVLRQRRAEREAHEFQTMSELAKAVEKFTVKIAVKTGEDGKMHGTVTTGQIADELQTHYAISLDKKKIHVDKPIRALGEHEVELRLHPEVRATLKILVESSTPLPAPAETTPAPAKEGKGRPEGRKPASKGERPEKAEAGAATGPKGDRKPRPPKSAKAE
jgi:large subunit ribosomal protein L9